MLPVMKLVFFGHPSYFGYDKNKNVAAVEFLTISPSTLRPFSQNIE
jgi:hypothetical protein